MTPTKIFTIASESEMKEQDFIIAETLITHTPTALVASAIEVKLVEKEAYVFTKDELVKFAYGFYNHGENGENFRLKLKVNGLTE